MAHTPMGHLIHMPAHIYLRVGDYAECVSSSLEAIRNDQLLFQQCLSPYFESHNRALLVMCSLYSGDATQALAVSQPVADLSPSVVRGMASMYPVPRVSLYYKYIVTVEQNVFQRFSKRVNTHFY